MKENINQLINMRKLALGVTITSAVLLSACSDNGSSNSNASDDDVNLPVNSYAYDVTLTNLTAAQPISPLAVVAHSREISLFDVGQPASVGLERMAEGGDNSELIAEANAAGAIAHATGNSPIAPADQATVRIEINNNNVDNLALTVTGMLVNTNDAFVGVNAISIATLAVDESITINGISYDSGTEANSETAGTMPGPADGGRGFDPVRDDIADQVTAHPGVISADDGLAESVLSQIHRWDNPSIRLTITRTQ